MQKLKVKLTGLSPLLMHSARFANPLDPLTKAHKALTSKRKKTDEDHAAIAKSEWLGSLYFEEGIGAYIPGLNVEACIFEAAKMQKLGKTAKRSILVVEDIIKLDYSGPKDPEKMYKNTDFVDVRAVKVGVSKIMRCRPKFSAWSCTFELNFNPEQIEEREILRALTDAGTLIGIGDFRPRFGKFSVDLI